MAKRESCDFKKIKAGDFFSRHSFGTVVSMDGSRATLKNLEDYEWTIDAAVLVQEFTFAEQFEATEKRTRTELIEILMDNTRTAMTVCFHKKPKHTDVAKALAEGQGELSDRAWSVKVRDLIEGEERIMVGQHTGKLDEHRRLHFFEQGTELRAVDPRTIDWLIVKRVKYEIK